MCVRERVCVSGGNRRKEERGYLNTSITNLSASITWQANAKNSIMCDKRTQDTPRSNYVERATAVAQAQYSKMLEAKGGKHNKLCL